MKERMKKMRKKGNLLKTVVALLLIIVSIAGCASESQQNQTANENEAQSESSSDRAGSESNGTASGDAGELPEPFKIACYDLSVHGAAEDCYRINLERIVNACGGELVYVPMQYTPDGVIDMIEQMLALEVDGIMFMPTTDSILPTIAKMCEEAQVYFGTVYRSVRDSEIQGILEQNPYYCGYTTEDDAGAAYDVGKYLAEQGMTKCAVINLEVGDVGGDDRDMGIKKAAEEFGFEIVAEARGLADAAETAKACESFMAAHPDLDGMINLGTYAMGGVEAMATSISNAGKEDTILLGTCDFYQSQQEWFDKGVIRIGRGGQHLIDNAMTLSNVVNAVIGTPVSEDGPTYVTASNVNVFTGDELREWYERTDSGQNIVFTDKVIKTSLIKYFNPEITQDSFKQFAADWGFDFLRSIEQ